MTRTEPRTFLAGAAVKRAEAHDEQPSCLACGARIGSGQPTIEIRGALVHLHCAMRRRKVGRR
jgi:hypothetical protein